IPVTRRLPASPPRAKPMRVYVRYHQSSPSQSRLARSDVPPPKKQCSSDLASSSHATIEHYLLFGGNLWTKSDGNSIPWLQVQSVHAPGSNSKATFSLLPKRLTRMDALSMTF